MNPGIKGGEWLVYNPAVSAIGKMRWSYPMDRRQGPEKITPEKSIFGAGP